MKISKMNNRIVIQKKSTETDDLLQHHDTWTDFYSCWSYANKDIGSEKTENSVISSNNTVIFTIRYCEKIKNITSQDYRILFRGVIYDITSIDNVMYNNTNVKITAVSKS